VTHHIVTGSEVREIGRLMIAFSEALGIEPNSIHSGELCQRVRDVVQERDDLKADQDQMMRTAEYFRLRNRDLSGLLRGMARRAAQHRQYGRMMSAYAQRSSQERDERQTVVERVLTEKDEQRWQLAKAISAATDLPWDELVVETRRVTEEWLARGTEIKRLHLLLARQDGKPNPWFTKPAEFPIEVAERADRERPSVAYAFRSQDFREQLLNGELDDAPTVRAAGGP
jgi:hypothetical protein